MMSNYGLTTLKRERLDMLEARERCEKYLAEARREATEQQDTINEINKKLADLERAIAALEPAPEAEPEPAPVADGVGMRLADRPWTFASAYRDGYEGRKHIAPHHPSYMEEYAKGAAVILPPTETSITIPEGFTAWGGGEWDGDPEAPVEVLFQNGVRCADNAAKDWVWRHTANYSEAFHVIAYRLLPQTADETPEPLGAEFAKVWDENVDTLHESDPAPEQPQGPSPVEDWQPIEAFDFRSAGKAGQDLEILFADDTVLKADRWSSDYEWNYRESNGISIRATHVRIDPAKPAPVNSTSAETETVQGEQQIAKWAEDAVRVDHRSTHRFTGEQPNPEPVGEDA